MRPTLFYISCEHAVNTIPPEYLKLFQGHESVLHTHRAIDFGAIEVATHLIKTFGCDHTTATASRLLIDCNRSINNKSCFSEFTAPLPEAEKQVVINQYYLPYRQKTEALIQANIDKGYQVLHISVHSFTPVFNDVVRNAGIGLLYDPKRHGEQEVTRQWQALLAQNIPLIRIRMNYPYKGASDGFTSALRKKHPEQHYLGIELEMNQSLMKNKESIDEMAHHISKSLQELIQLL